MTAPEAGTGGRPAKLPITIAAAGLAVLLVWGAWAGRPRAPAAEGPVFDAEWIALPTPDDVVAVYPDKARRERLADKALVNMRCVIAPDGSLETCEVLSDSLPGYGFGDAALKVSARFRVKTQASDGRSLVGLPIGVPLGFDPIHASPDR